MVHGACSCASKISDRKENYSATILVTRQFSRFVAIIDNNLGLYVCKKWEPAPNP